MLVGNYGLCPDCGHEIDEESKFCPECGINLEWKNMEEYFPPKPERKKREGHINCDCGQKFYYETMNFTIRCIKCGKEHKLA